MPVLRARVAMAENRWNDAVSEVGKTIPTNCLGCLWLTRGMAYDGGGNRDSAIVWYERYLDRALEREASDAPIARRLGELYEGKGDLRAALASYDKFLVMWKRADASLAPQIAEVQRRVVRLHARERAAR